MNELQIEFNKNIESMLCKLAKIHHKSVKEIIEDLIIKESKEYGLIETRK